MVGQLLSPMGLAQALSDVAPRQRPDGVAFAWPCRAFITRPVEGPSFSLGKLGGPTDPQGFGFDFGPANNLFCGDRLVTAIAKACCGGLIKRVPDSARPLTTHPDFRSVMLRAGHGN